jgi:PAS domain S-box-containing protein
MLQPLTSTSVVTQPISKTLNVLVLDDSQGEAESAIFELRQSGIDLQWMQVQTELEFEQALAIDVDLIIADYQLEKLNAFRALELLKKRGKDIPFIVISAPIGEELAAAVMRQGAHDFLIKNRLERLSAAVTQALAGKWLRCQREEADERRRAVEVLFRILTQHSLAGIYVLRDGRFVYANSKIAEILGYTVEELHELDSWTEVVAEEDRDMVREQVRRRMSGEVPQAHYVLRGLRKDGTVVDLEIRSSQILYQGRTAVLGMLIDISDRRRAEDSLRASEERFRNAFELTNVPMVLTDLNHHFVRVNEAFSRLLGYSQAEMLELSLADITYPDDLPLSVANREPLLAGLSDYFQMEKRYYHKNGNIIWALANVSLIRDSHGHPRQYVGQVQDITERQQALWDLRKVANDLAIAYQVIEQERAQLAVRVAERTSELSAANERLAAVNKELEAFSYSVSHDLRAPLRGIDGYSRIVLEDYGPKLDEDGRRLLNVVRSESQRMGHLIDDLLDFSRVGRQTMQTGVVDLTELTQTVYESLDLKVRQRVSHFHLQSLPPTVGDRAMLRQVLVNLLSNAFKFTGQQADPRIEVGSTTDEVSNIYFVKDNGVGFDPRYAHKLFGVFQRLHSEDEFEGTGVGLALVQRIVQRHGGKVWAEGKVNEGATFYFSLPPRKDKEQICTE